MTTTEIDRLVDSILMRPRECCVTKRSVDSDNTTESTVIVIDHSGSTGAPCGNVDRLEASKRGAEAYIARRLHISPFDTVACVVFDDTATVISTFVGIKDAERELLRPLRRVSVGGGTDISSGLKSAESILTRAQNNSLRRLVLLSDGEDGGSPYHISDRIKSAGTIVDTIGVGNTPFEIDESCLKRIASVVDGVLRYKFISDADDLAEHFENIALDLVRINR